MQREPGGPPTQVDSNAEANLPDIDQRLSDATDGGPTSPCKDPTTGV